MGVLVSGGERRRREVVRRVGGSGVVSWVCWSARGVCWLLLVEGRGERGGWLVDGWVVREEVEG